MYIQVVTIFPELFGAFLETSLIGRAREKDLLQIGVHDLRDFTDDRHRVVDDEPYGGGGGMVMIAPPWLRAVRSLSEAARNAGRRPRRILLSPQGERLDEAKVRELATHEELILLCARYEGIDERVRELEVDEEVSLGDFVVCGGETPAMVLIEAVSRQVPGVVGFADSVVNDSFRRGLLDYPHYTRPRVVEENAVPEVLLSGNHAVIDAWRERQALQATLRKRPDLLDGLELDKNRRRLLRELREELLREELEQERASSAGE